MAKGRRLVKRAARPKRVSYPNMDREQTKVLNTVLRVGKRKGASRKELRAAASTALVESGARNLGFGNADSLGWRQERTSQYGDGPKGARNVRASARRFFEESRTDTGGSRGRGMSQGQLAQAIQGSAHPEKYDQRGSEARKIVRRFEKANGRVKSQQLSGDWGGAEKATRQIVGGKNLANATSTKRSHTVGGASSTGSDHHTSQKSAYAVDLPHNQSALDRINKKLGTSLKLGQDQTVNYKGYRVQVITSPHGTGPHIHVGVRFGEGNPSSGGSYGGSGATGGSSGNQPSRDDVFQELAAMFIKRSKASRVKRTKVRKIAPEKQAAKRELTRLGL